MVFGEPWFEGSTTQSFKEHISVHEDEHLRMVLSYLASNGACKLIPAILLAAGFGAGGIAGGSLAALWQSSIGNVAGGSMFAFLQSAGAGGHGALTLQTMCEGLAVKVPVPPVRKILDIYSWSGTLSGNGREHCKMDEAMEL